jgi:hypothetical protein
MLATPDGCRGIAADWVVAATVPPLVSSVTIAEWSAIGFGDRPRIAPGTVEILGALLCAFQRLVSLGTGLLIPGFLVARALHIMQGYWSWWLGRYVALVVILEHSSRRERDAGRQFTALGPLPIRSWNHLTSRTKASHVQLTALHTTCAAPQHSCDRKSTHRVWSPNLESMRSPTARHSHSIL